MSEYPNGGKGAFFLLSDLRLGDTVQAFEGPYGTAIVKQVDDANVYFFRPYGHGESWSHSGGIICYIGLEEFSRPRSKTDTIKVWRRETIT